jgi:hypothetical protein
VHTPHPEMSIVCALPAPGACPCLAPCCPPRSPRRCAQVSGLLTRVVRCLESLAGLPHPHRATDDALHRLVPLLTLTTVLCFFGWVCMCLRMRVLLGGSIGASRPICAAVLARRSDTPCHPP